MIKKPRRLRHLEFLVTTLKCSTEVFMFSLIQVCIGFLISVEIIAFAIRVRAVLAAWRV